MAHFSPHMSNQSALLEIYIYIWDGNNSDGGGPLSENLLFPIFSFCLLNHEIIFSNTESLCFIYIECYVLNINYWLSGMLINIFYFVRHLALTGSFLGSGS